jgi:hypothetical protein
MFIQNATFEKENSATLPARAESLMSADGNGGAHPAMRALPLG